MKKTAIFLGVRYRVLALGPEHPQCILIPSVDKKTGHISVTLADILPDGNVFPCMRLTSDITPMALPEDTNHFFQENVGLLGPLKEAGVIREAGEACGQTLYAWNRAKMLAASDTDPDATPDKVISGALTALKGLRLGGYIPYASPAPSSTEMQLRKALDSAMTLREIASDLDAALYRV